MDARFGRIKNGNVTLIDVRPRDAYDILHIPGPNSIPIEALEMHLASLPPNLDITADCRGKYCLLFVEAVKLLSAHRFICFRFEESPQAWYSRHSEE